MKLFTLSFLSTIFLLQSISFGQMKANLAEKHFTNLEYYKAAPIYKELADKYLKKKKGSLDYVLKTAISKGKIYDFKTSNYYFDLYIKNSTTPLTEEIYLSYINQLRIEKKYAASKAQALKALSHYPENKVLQHISTSSDEAIHKLREDSTLNNYHKMPFNSGAGDFAPTFYEGGLIYTTKAFHPDFLSGKYGWDNGNYTNLVFTKNTNGNWLKPSLLKKSFHSRAHDGPVAFNEQENRMVITHNYSGKEKKKGTRYLALYFSDKLPDGTWSYLTPFPHDHLESNTGHGCFAQEGNRIYFVSDKKNGVGKTDLYYSDLENGKWSAPVNLGKQINTEGNEMFPFVTKDNQLYFASDGHLGLGGLDVFVVDLNNPNAIPQNLGAGINSSSDDFGLIVDKTGNSGYLSSNREDFIDRVYFWERKEPQINLEVKLIAAFNPEELLPNHKVDIAENGKTKAFITSQNSIVNTTLKVNQAYEIIASKDYFIQTEQVFVKTENIKRDTTIYRTVFLKPTTINVKIKVVNKKSKEPITASKVRIRKIKDNDEEIVFTDEEGFVELVVDREEKYWASASKKGFIDGETPFQTGNQTGKIIELELELPEIVKGDKFKLENIFYDYDAATLRQESESALNQLAEFLLENNLRIELSAHTDARGSATYNKKLSQRRAQSCVDYLVARGISPSNIIAIGYGESLLVNKCKDGVNCSEEEHQENRRTEVKILEVKK